MTTTTFEQFATEFAAKVLLEFTALSDEEKEKIFEEFKKVVANYTPYHPTDPKNYPKTAAALFYFVWNKLEYNWTYPLKWNTLCESYEKCDELRFEEALEDYYVSLLDSLVIPPTPPPLDISSFRFPIMKKGTPEEAYEAASHLYPLVSSSGLESKKSREVCGYRVVKKLGEGAYGKVYLTDDGKALKIVDQQWDPRTGMNGGVFDEVVYQSELDNPYITKILDVEFDCKGDEDKKEMAILMPLAVGTLYDLKQNPTWNFSSKNRYASGIKALRFKLAHDIVCGVNYLHKNNIMSLDLKPQNILLFLNDRKEDKFGLSATISDLGLAQNIYGERWRGPNEIVSGIYRDPRLSCEIDHKYNENVDIWSLGLILMDIFFNYQIPEQDSGIDLPKTISKSILTKLEMNSDFTQELLEVEKPNENAIWCLAIDDYLREKKIKLSTSLEPYLRDRLFFASRYYTPEEYKNIWQVIDAALQLDIKKRASAEHLLHLPLFDSMYEDMPTCNYVPLKYIEFEEENKFIDDDKSLTPRVKNIARFYIKRIIDANIKPTPEPWVIEFAAIDWALKYYNNSNTKFALKEPLELQDKVLKVLGRNLMVGFRGD